MSPYTVTVNPSLLSSLNPYFGTWNSDSILLNNRSECDSIRHHSRGFNLTERLCSSPSDIYSGGIGISVEGNLYATICI